MGLIAMGGRKHLISEDSDGKQRRISVDPAHVDRQMAEERAAGRKPYVLDDDDLIQFGLLMKQAGKKGK